MHFIYIIKLYKHKLQLFVVTIIHWYYKYENLYNENMKKILKIVTNKIGKKNNTFHSNQNYINNFYYNFCLHLNLK